MNTFGHSFRLSIWGESHGESVGITLDGLPAGLALSTADFEYDLARRQAGKIGTTTRHEQDAPRLLSGVYNGHTTGAPLTICFENHDIHSDDYTKLIDHPRPSHADRAMNHKWEGWNDPRGGGHASGRLTVALVAAGVVAKKILTEAVEFNTQLIEVGGQKDSIQFEAIITQAQANGDSVGGVVECRIDGISTGIGSPFFDSVESVMSHLLFAIPAVKGVEFGAGFGAAQTRGSQNNDMIINAMGTTGSNHDGGINGGITNGNPIIVRVAFKPTPSIAREQMTYNYTSESIASLTIGGRHDACVALRGAVVVEAVAAITLANFILRQ